MPKIWVSETGQSDLKGVKAALQENKVMDASYNDVAAFARIVVETLPKKDIEIFSQKVLEVKNESQQS